jgi:vacuolar protein sorting-associated protein IST1
MGKYGRDYSTAVMENVDGRVSERVSILRLARVRSGLINRVTQVSKKLAANLITPSPELVDAYLAEIARGYSIPWAPATEVCPLE